MNEAKTVLVERHEAGGHVVLTATAVHEHGCRAWRMGARHGPCTCGASDLWAKHGTGVSESLDLAARAARHVRP